MASAAPIFLLVDDNRDRRSLLVRTIRRKFPSALVHECADAEPAMASVREGIPDAIVLHRATEISGGDLLTMIRREDPAVPVVYLAVSERNRDGVETRGGHTRFLNYDAWLNLGTVLEELLGVASSKKAGTAAP